MAMIFFIVVMILLSGGYLKIGKDPLSGRVDGFQIDPNIKRRKGRLQEHDPGAL